MCGRERDREKTSNPGKPAGRSVAQAQALSQTTGMLSPGPSRGEEGGGEGEGTHRAEEDKAQDTYREALTNKNHHTHPHIDNHSYDYTIRASSHSCISAISFKPCGIRIWQNVFFCIAQHAHITQDSSCPGLKDELQKHSSKDIPCVSLILKKKSHPYAHFYLYYPIRSLKTHCG